MTSSARFESLFFEVFEPLPRQGPGSRASARRALDLCKGLPPSPAVLDLGCGAGAQSFHLADLTAGTIVAVDLHAPLVDRLAAEAARRGLAERIQPRVADIGALEYAPRSFDLLWSEGALYNVGIERALRLYAPLLKAGGYLAFTEAVWLNPDPPAEARAAFSDYAAMGSIADVSGLIEASDLSLVDHFTLPNEDWWNEFYTPMVHRIDELRDVYAGDTEALAVLDELAREPAVYRRCSHWYGYEFFVVRRAQQA